MDLLFTLQVMSIVSGTSLSLAAAISWWRLHRLWRDHKARLDDANATHSKLEDALNRSMLLQALLHRLCVESFKEQHIPAWAAWHQTMGAVQVRFIPHISHDPEDEEGSASD